MMALDEDAFDYAFESVPKLVGRANFVTWERNVMLALGVLGLWDFAEDGTESLSDLEPAIRDLHDMWIVAYILETCEQSVKDLHSRIFDDDGAGRTRALLQALEKSYGVMAHRSILGLGMDFMYSKCDDGQDVEDWMDTVSAQRRALEEAKFTIEDMAVIVILRGLPSRFSHYVDHVLMTNDKVPKLDEVRRAIRAVDAAHQVEMKRKEEDLALAARARQLVLSEQQSSMDTPPRSRSSRRRKNKKRKEEERKQEVQVEYALTAICH